MRRATYGYERTLTIASVFTTGPAVRRIIGTNPSKLTITFTNSIRVIFRKRSCREGDEGKSVELFATLKLTLKL